MIYPLDFMTSKMKHIRQTERDGYKHLLFSIVPLIYVMFYVYLQGSSGDYKEMMTGISAALLCLFHVSRTIWGLLQLRKFRNWNIRALQVLSNLGINLPSPKSNPYVPRVSLRPRAFLQEIFSFFHSPSSSTAFPKTTTSEEQNLVSSEHKSKNPENDYKTYVDLVNNNMVVNDSLIDNEFFDANNPCKISKHRFMCSVHPQKCTIYWQVAFLSVFGSNWIKGTQNISSSLGASDSIQEEMKMFSKRLGVNAILKVTKGSSVCEESRVQIKLSSRLSPENDLCADMTSISKSTFNYEEPNAMPYLSYNHNSFDIDFSMFESDIRDISASWYTKSTSKISDHDMEAVRLIKPVQLACFSKLMEEKNWGRTQNPTKFVARNVRGPPMNTFLRQIDMDGDLRYHDISKLVPYQKSGAAEHFTPLILQASVHVDNFIALEYGSRIEKLFSNHEQENYLDVFRNQKEIQLRCYQLEVCESSSSQDLFLQHIRFIGCIMEVVRDQIRKIMELTSSYGDGSNNFNCKSSVDGATFSFFCSEQLRESFKNAYRVSYESSNAAEINRNRSVHQRMIWEVQYFLHDLLLNNQDAEEVNDVLNIDQSKRMKATMMLCILGFPSLAVRREAHENLLALNGTGDTCVNIEERKISLSVEVVKGPQNLRILIKVLPSSGLVTIILQEKALNKTVTYFDWQKWKDAFMGRIIAQKEWRHTRLGFNEEYLVDSFAKYPLQTTSGYFRLSISDPTDVRASHLYMWRGWMPHTVEISGNEIFNLMKDEKLGAHEVIESMKIMIKDFKNEEEGNNLYEITSIDEASPSFEMIYENARRKQDDGQLNIALKLYFSCIRQFGDYDSILNAIKLIEENMSSSMVGSNEHVNMIICLEEGLNALLKKSIEYDVTHALQKLAELSAATKRLYNQTENLRLLSLEGECWLYSSPSRQKIREEAFQAFEASIIHEKNPKTSLCLGICYLRNFQISDTTSYKDLGMQYLSAWCMESDCVPLIAMLFEKGIYRGRDAKWASEYLDGIHSNLYLIKLLRDLIIYEEQDPENTNETDVVITDNLKNINAAIRLYEHIANNCREGASMGLNRLGIIYYTGEHVEQDIEKSKLCFQKAFSGQFISLDFESATNAMVNMSVLESNWKSKNINKEDARRYTDEAISLFEKRTGDISSSTGLNNRAVMYEIEAQTQNDSLEKAIQLYEIADQCGDLIGMYNYGVLLKWGNSSGFNPTAETIQKANDIFDRILEDQQEFLPMEKLIYQVSVARRENSSESGAVQLWDLFIEESSDTLCYVKLLQSTKSIVGLTKYK